MPVRIDLATRDDLSDVIASAAVAPAGIGGDRRVDARDRQVRHPRAGRPVSRGGCGLPAGSAALDAGPGAEGRPLRLASLVWGRDVRVHAVDLERACARLRRQGPPAIQRRRPAPRWMSHHRDPTARRRRYRAGYRTA